MLSREELYRRAARIRYFFCDIDGTLTDGITYYSEKGEELKGFSHIDGTGFHILKNLSVEAGFITGENSLIVQRRADKLKIVHCFLGISDKLQLMKDFINERGAMLEEVAYIGDDLNDLLLIKEVGISFVTANARQLCKDNAAVILQKSGGNGAFREAVELLAEWKRENVWELFNRK